MIGFLSHILGSLSPRMPSPSSVIPNAVLVEIGSVKLRLDPSVAHERRYISRYVGGQDYPQSDIDELLFEQFIQPGDVVLDAGANIGVTAALALKYGASKVHAVEAEPTLYSRLRSLKDPRISAYHFAVGERDGFVNLHICSHSHGHTTTELIRTNYPNLYDGTITSVPQKTLEYILRRQHCTVWKLDIEGAEASAIRGAFRSLQNGPRVIFAELYETVAEEIADLLKSNYSMQRVALRKDSYRLDLLPFHFATLTDDYHATSPTYVLIKS